MDQPVRSGHKDTAEECRKGPHIRIHKLHPTLVTVRIREDPVRKEETDPYLEYKHQEGEDGNKTRRKHFQRY